MGVIFIFLLGSFPKNKLLFWFCLIFLNLYTFLQLYSLDVIIFYPYTHGSLYLCETCFLLNVFDFVFVFFLWFSCDLCWVYLVLWYCSNLSLCVVFLNLTFFLYCIQICILLLLVIALFSVSLLKETGCWLSFMLCNWTGEAIYL